MGLCSCHTETFNTGTKPCSIVLCFPSLSDPVLFFSCLFTLILFVWQQPQLEFQQNADDGGDWARGTNKQPQFEMRGPPQSSAEAAGWERGQVKQPQFEMRGPPQSSAEAAGWSRGQKPERPAHLQLRSKLKKTEGATTNNTPNKEKKEKKKKKDNKWGSSSDEEEDEEEEEAAAAETPASSSPASSSGTDKSELNFTTVGGGRKSGRTDNFKKFTSNRGGAPQRSTPQTKATNSRFSALQEDTPPRAPSQPPPKVSPVVTSATSATSANAAPKRTLNSRFANL